MTRALDDMLDGGVDSWLSSHTQRYCVACVQVALSVNCLTSGSRDTLALTLNGLSSCRFRLTMARQAPID